MLLCATQSSATCRLSRLISGSGIDNFLSWLLIVILLLFLVGYCLGYVIPIAASSIVAGMNLINFYVLCMYALAALNTMNKVTFALDHSAAQGHFSICRIAFAVLK